MASIIFQQWTMDNEILEYSRKGTLITIFRLVSGECIRTYADQCFHKMQVILIVVRMPKYHVIIAVNLDSNDGHVYAWLYAVSFGVLLICMSSKFGDGVDTLRIS